MECWNQLGKGKEGLTGLSDGVGGGGTKKLTTTTEIKEERRGGRTEPPINHEMKKDKGAGPGGKVSEEGSGGTGKRNNLRRKSV